MKDFLTGLWTYIQTTSASSFYNGIGGRIYYGSAPSGTQFPYSALNIDSNTHDWQFKTDYEEPVVLLNIFSDDPDGSEVLDLELKARDAFDEANFTVTNHTLIKFRFDNEWLSVDPNIIPNKMIWQYSIQYRALLRKST